MMYPLIFFPNRYRGKGNVQLIGACPGKIQDTSLSYAQFPLFQPFKVKLTNPVSPRGRLAAMPTTLTSSLIYASTIISHQL